MAARMTPNFATPVPLRSRARAKSACLERTQPHHRAPQIRRVQLCVASNEASFEALTHDLRAHLATEQARISTAPTDDTPDGDAPVTPGTLLSYAALGRAGRGDLVERMMAHGGYFNVMAQLDVVPESVMEEVKPERTEPRFSPELSDARLALGARLERRLAAPVEGSASTEASQRARAADDVPSAAELGAALRDAPAVTEARPAPAGELLTLDTRMRACMLLLVALAAAGHGRASVGVLPSEVIAVCRVSADVLALLHTALATYAGVLSATRLGRSPLLWMAKTLLGGAGAVFELRRLGAVEGYDEQSGIA